MSGIRDGAAVRRRRRGAAPAGGPSRHAWTALQGKVVDVPVLVSWTNRADAQDRDSRDGGAADNLGTEELAGAVRRERPPPSGTWPMPWTSASSPPGSDVTPFPSIRLFVGNRMLITSHQQQHARNACHRPRGISKEHKRLRFEEA